MSQTSSGHVGLSAQEKLDKADQVLDQFENNIGLPGSCPSTVEDGARQLLSMSPGEMRALTAVERDEAAYTLFLYAFYLQRIVNREQARVRWAEEGLSKILGPLMAQQKAYSWEERRSLAVRGDDAALKLDEIRIKAQLKVDRISFLAMKVEKIAEHFQYRKLT